jgi:hypothetical protein
MVIFPCPTALGKEGVCAVLAKPQPVTMAELAGMKTEGVSVVEVSDYVYGNYKGDFPSPPHADLNPKKAFIIYWKDFPFRFVFSHEASYCPWFELPSGAGVSYQFFEGNDGWAELFNQWGRQERNSFMDILESGPKRVWVRWTYFGVNMQAGEPAYRATEDFWAYPNGLILRGQTYQSLIPGQRRGYAREPIELIAMCPVGKMWFDVLEKDPSTGESHALAVLDAFSNKRYDVYWKRRLGTFLDATFRRTGCRWADLQESSGVVFVYPLVDGSGFCAFGDASGFHHSYTNIKEFTFGAYGWISSSWDHWPIGWLNSQGHVVDEDSLKQYPNHFAPDGMDFFPLNYEESERGIYYSLIGVAGEDLEKVRTVARRWLEKEEAGVANSDSGADLPATFARRRSP